MAFRRMGLAAPLFVAAGALAACDSEVNSPPGEGGGGSAATTTTATTSTSTSTGASVVATGTGTGTGGAGGAGGAGGGGGEGGGASTAPPFRTPVEGTDADIALRALQLLGADVDGAEDGCVPCHALSEANLRSWEELTNASLTECLTALDVPSQEVAEQMLECVRARSGIPDSKFASHALGFWSAGARRDWWAYTFDVAYPEDGDARLAAFVDQVQMPPTGEETLTEEEYDVVAEWFVRGAPLLDELLDEEPPPGGCDVHLAPAIADHVAAMATEGWRAVNAGNGMLMHGCAGADDPRDCLADVPPADPAWLVDGAGQLKVLATYPYESSFWTRGSSAGRYVAHGSWQFEGHSAIVDLQAGATIGVQAAYDPAFFPDDSGFVFQGGASNVCPISVLAGPPATVTMTEPGCSALSEVGLYQHVGAALGGGDYFAVSGPFVSDDGGHQTTLQNPQAFFSGNSASFLTPMIFDGTTFDAKTPIPMSTPFEGDATLSPSARLVMSRVAGQNARQNGYSLRLVEATPDGQGSYDVDAPRIGRYCINGGKPAFSFDERWVVVHRYVENTNDDAIALGFAGKNDPNFAPYADEGAANVWLVELATNRQIRLTNVAPGQYALFPSFRSDGWIYFVVREPGSGGETIVASDGALVAESE